MLAPRAKSIKDPLIYKAAAKTSAPMQPKLALPDVVLYAIDTAQVGLTIKSMKKCMEQCDFGDVFLITNAGVKAPFRVEVVSSINRYEDVPKFAVRGLNSFIKKPFALTVSWDAFIIHPEMWRPDFLNYDYIGPKWPWYKDGMTIGNSGFSLRSKKLSAILEAMPVEFTDKFADDVFIGRTARPKLEKEHGIKYPAEAVADLFAYERSIPAHPTFGFHGLFNMWRYLGDEDLTEVAEQVGDYKLLYTDYAEVMVNCYGLRRFKPFLAFYRRIRRKFSSDGELAKHLFQYIPNRQMVLDSIQCGEAYSLAG